MAAMGLRLDQKPLYLATNVVTERPKGLAWTDFPVLAQPRFSVRVKDGDAYRPLSESMAAQPFLPYLECAGAEAADRTLDKRARISALSRSINPNQPLAVSEKGRDFVVTDAAGFGAKAAGGVHARYNYSFNMRAILHPALKDVRSRPLPEWPGSARWEVVRREAELERAMAGLRNSILYREPAALQVLFAISEATAEETRRLYAVLAGDVWLKGFDIGGRIREGRWLGTGKYRSLDLVLRMDAMLFGAVGSGFLEIDHSRRSASVSDAGRTLLKSLHKDNRDPDLPLRFIDTAEGTSSAAAIPAIDDCYRRFFRKMKAKLHGTL